VIAFGASISGAEAYARYAEPGIRRAAEPDSEVALRKPRTCSALTPKAL